MARKALLIGSQTGELSGVDNDIGSMKAALDLWGFSSTRCVAADATRAGILDAFDRLIAGADSGDAIVIYYSGHGGYCLDRDSHTDTKRRLALQFIVPTDIEESKAGDFRGIMSVELAMRLARLTDRCRNVTVALDCCHAAHMARKGKRGLIVKAQPHPVSYDTVISHFEGLQRQLRSVNVWLPPTNQWVVRIVACAPEQAAYEYNNTSGLRTGMMTDALTEALTQAHTEGLQVSWATVIDRVRQRVLARMPVQRPEAEGPARRLLFQTRQADSVATLPVLVTGDRVSLGGASLLGVSVGDEFTIMPADSSAPDEQTRVGDVVIDEVRDLAAGGVLKLRQPGVAVPLGMRAYQTKAAAPAMPVRLPRTEIGLASAMRRTPILRPAEPGEACPVEVRVDDAGGLAIWDQAGPLHPPQPADPLGVEHVMQNLKRLAWANSLRRLAPEATHTLQMQIEVEFGLVHDGEPEPLPSSGAILYLGQRIYLRVRNKGRNRVHVSLVDIGVSAQITVLNTDTPGGEPLDPEEEYTYGWHHHKRALHGSPLSWPAGTPRTQPRPETVIVLVTSRPHEIRGLEHDGARAITGPGGSALERLLDQIVDGVQRDLSPGEAAPERFLVRTVDFEVVPVPPPVGEQAEFQVDERPEQSVLLWSPKGAAPAKVAVRLTDLVVHRNRAFHHADIRVDAMVLTRGTSRQPVCAAQTERFSNIRDEQRLPLDKMLIYHGPAVDYLDLAVWVTRDASGSLALSDLLRDKLNDSDVQMAMGNIGGLLVAAPQAAMAVAAIGAGAVLINTAYHLLTRMVGPSIGLYRTTLLAGERFGVGRPSVVRAQDFSFTYSVEDVS